MFVKYGLLSGISKIKLIKYDNKICLHWRSPVCMKELAFETYME